MNRRARLVGVGVLFGLGLGLIVAGALLRFGKGVPAAQEPVKPTRDEVVALAREYGLVVVEATPGQGGQAKPDDNKPTPPAPPPPALDASQVVEVTVPEGSSAHAIADLMAEAGLLTDPDGFLHYLADQGLDTRLRAGSFEFPKGARMDQLAEILTR